MQRWREHKTQVKNKDSKSMSCMLDLVCWVVNHHVQCRAQSQATVSPVCMGSQDMESMASKLSDRGNKSAQILMHRLQTPFSCFHTTLF